MRTTIGEMFRHITDMKIRNGTNPFDDNHFKVIYLVSHSTSSFQTAVSRLQEIEKLVKERIYILDAFPQVTNDITKILNNFLTKGISFTDVTFGKTHFIIQLLRNLLRTDLKSILYQRKGCLD